MCSQHDCKVSVSSIEITIMTIFCTYVKDYYNIIKIINFGTYSSYSIARETLSKCDPFIFIFLFFHEFQNVFYFLPIITIFSMVNINSFYFLSQNLSIIFTYFSFRPILNIISKIISGYDN